MRVWRWRERIPFILSNNSWPHFAADIMSKISGKGMAFFLSNYAQNSLYKKQKDMLEPIVHLISPNYNDWVA